MSGFIEMLGRVSLFAGAITFVFTAVIIYGYQIQWRKNSRTGQLRSWGSISSSLFFAIAYLWALPVVWFLYGWRRVLKIYVVCMLGTFALALLLARLGIVNQNFFSAILVGIPIRIGVAYIVFLRHDTWRAACKVRRSKPEGAEETKIASAAGT